jgi:hypothetical protein
VVTLIPQVRSEGDDDDPEAQRVGRRSGEEQAGRQGGHHEAGDVEPQDAEVGRERGQAPRADACDGEQDEPGVPVPSARRDERRAAEAPRGRRQEDTRAEEPYPQGRATGVKTREGPGDRKAPRTQGSHPGRRNDDDDRVRACDRRGSENDRDEDPVGEDPRHRLAREGLAGARSHVRDLGRSERLGLVLELRRPKRSS